MRASLDLFGSMVWKNFIVMFRYPINFISSFATLFVIIVIFVFATLMFTPGGAREALAGGVSRGIGGAMLYGFVLFLFVSDSLWSIGYNIRWEQHEGTLESLYLTPANRFLYLVSRATFPLVWTSLNAAAGLLFMRFLFGALPVANVGLALYTLAFILSGVFGLGFVFAAYTLLVKAAAESTANLLQFVLLTVCAMFVPFSALPVWLRAISRLVPLSYGVDLFRSALLDFPTGFPELASPSTELVIVTAWGIFMPLVGFMAYRYAEHRVRTNGSLAEF